MAINRQPTSWVTTLPWGRVHIVTDADPQYIFWVSSRIILPKSFSNLYLNTVTGLYERNFQKWFDWVFFTHYDQVFAAFGNTRAAKQIQAAHPSLITVLDIPADPADARILNPYGFLALGLQGQEGEPPIDAETLTVLQTYKDPYRDPAFN